MTTLHLGVIDLPYQDPSPTAKKKPGKRVAKEQPNISTGDVAEILEAQYHVMEVFWQLHGQEGADALVQSVVGASESVLLGAPIGADPFAEAGSKIEVLFHDFLTNKEMDALGYPGVPTLASLQGISHRFKNRRGPPRPSFIDTGQYVNAFKAWTDENES